MQPLTHKQLIELFPQQRLRDLAPPKVEAIDWGVLDYLGWIHPTGRQAFAVVSCASGYRGLRLNRTINNSAPPRSHMCNWCNFVHRSRGAAMFSATVSGSDGRRIIGHMLCRNLDCSVRIRNLTGDTPAYMPETLNLESKVRRLDNSLQIFMTRLNIR
jgi:hypothetical protein